MSHAFHHTGNYPDQGPTTLFLPGWGFDGRILQLLKPEPQWIYPAGPLDPETLEQDLLHLLAAEKIKMVRLVGWSLGAMLGLEFAARHPDLVDSLVLVSLRPHWPGAEIAAIRQEFSQDPQGFLKGFFRKCFLGDKAAYADFRADLEPLHLAGAQNNMDTLLRGLDFLGSFTLPVPAPDIPITLLHGKQDIIAPVEEMAALPGAAIEIINQAGHGVLLHRDSSLYQELKKQEIRLKFSRAADSYDRYAKVQTEVAARLAVKLPAAQNTMKTILEIGCGTGNFTGMLAERYPNARITALDFSREMLAKARQKLASDRIEFVCAEGERFLRETPDQAFDLVVSNGSLQWFADIDKTLGNIARILAPGGVMACSIFGPESLQELGEGLLAMQTGQEDLAAQGFPTWEKLRELITEIFQTAAMEEAAFAREYPSAHDLLLHIKKTGTSGWHRKTQQPLTPSRLKQLDAWFHETRGSCRVTYQVFFLQGSR